jgi:hypothetical protein
MLSPRYLFPSPLRGKIKEWGALQRFDDLLHDSIYVFQHVVIPKSQDNKSLVTQPIITLRIIIRVFRMLSAINFNHQPFFQAHIIDNILPHWLLPAKFKTVNLPETKLLPE